MLNETGPMLDAASRSLNGSLRLLNIRRKLPMLCERTTSLQSDIRGGLFDIDYS